MTVYIASFPDGFRVAASQDMESVYYYFQGTPERKQRLREIFGRSERFADLGDAIKVAEKLADDMDCGMSYIGAFESFS